MSEQRYGSIDRLRIYQASRSLEDSVYELVKSLPKEEFYGLGNDLRRSSAAISHYVSEAHKRFSYTLKLEALHLARTESERLQDYLEQHAEQGYGNTRSLQNACEHIAKQAWGLIKYFKRRQAERQSAARITAADELVAARRP